VADLVSHPWDPDWVVAPGETLREWLEDRRLSPRVAAACLGKQGRVDAVIRIEDVLARRPLNAQTARVLEVVTDVPARFWLALDSLCGLCYRSGVRVVGEP